MSKNFLLRTDGNPAIGTGHVMRCLALAQALRDAGGSATFLSSTLPETLTARLKQEQCAVLSLGISAYGRADVLETARCARDIGADWLIVDGYSFDADYQAQAKAQGLNVLFIDDYGHAENYAADIVLNQNIYAREDMYKYVGASTSLMLGTRYALLRKEFWPWQTWMPNTPEQAKNILVTLGGYDTHNAVAKVIDVLKNIREPIGVTVLVGRDDPRFPEVQESIRDSGVPFRLASNVTNMPELMAESDVAISAGGTTCYELAFMQLPAMTVVLADNQRMLAQAMEDAGLSINLGTADDLEKATLIEYVTGLLMNKQQRSRRSAQGGKCVDGQGASRVCMRLTGDPLRLRPANDGDANLLWEWANDPAARASAFSTDPIPWEEHVAWFERKIRDPLCSIFIAIDVDEKPVGQTRFDLTETEEAEMDVSVAREARGKKFAAPLIDLSVRKFFASTGVHRVSAHVREDNEYSIRSFERAGFLFRGVEKNNGIRALHYVRVRP